MIRIYNGMVGTRRGTMAIATTSTQATPHATQAEIL